MELELTGKQSIACRRGHQPLISKQKSRHRLVCFVSSKLNTTIEFCICVKIFLGPQTSRHNTPSTSRLIEKAPFILHKRLLYPQSKYDTHHLFSHLWFTSCCSAARKSPHPETSPQQQRGDRLFDRIWCAALRLTTLQAVTNHWCAKHLRF